MTRVLVVTDNERVQSLFEDLQSNGILTLCTVSNLMQSDEQIANFCPDFTFVQSRISGLSGDIILRHLKKLLPPEGRTVLLALDPQDAAQGRKQGARIVELSESGEGLAQKITTVLEGGADQLRKKKTAGQAPGTRRARAAKKGDAAEIEAPVSDPSPLAGEGVVEQPLSATESGREEAPEPDAGPAPHPAETVDDAPSAAEADGVAPGVATFAEMMQRAEATAVAGAGAVEDKVDAGSRSDFFQPTQPIRPLQDSLGSDGYEPEGWSGGGGRGPKHRSKPHPLWTFPLVLIMILLPVLYLLPPEKKGAQPPEPTPKNPAPKAARAPALPPQAPVPVPVPVASLPIPTPTLPLNGRGDLHSLRSISSKPVAAIPAARPTPASQAVPRQAPVTAQDPKQSGLRELPQFLRGVTLDHAYAKAHPGWQRYVGARAEYKLYQEGGLYKALQVIALTGQTVPEDIMKKALQEFGGIDSYQVQSTERKQHFLVDHGRARGNLAVTVYRRINDRRVKGLVLYYMK
jgi:CheY-like chemotaxis protein